MKKKSFFNILSTIMFVGISLGFTTGCKTKCNKSCNQPDPIPPPPITDSVFKLHAEWQGCRDEVTPGEFQQYALGSGTASRWYFPGHDLAPTQYTVMCEPLGSNNGIMTLELGFDSFEVYMDNTFNDEGECENSQPETLTCVVDGLFAEDNIPVEIVIHKT